MISKYCRENTNTKKIQICITFERKKLYNNYVIKINQLRSTCT